MITLAQAINDTKEAISLILLQAGFANGSKGIVDDKPMFWFINVTSIEGGEKETYLTYSFSTVPGQNQHGDGQPISRYLRVDLNLWSRKKDVDDLIKKLEDVFVLRGFPFELDNIDYDSGNQLYRYSFYTNCVVS